jgi:hypothetical protein
MLLATFRPTKKAKKGERKVHRVSFLALLVITATTFGQTERASDPYGRIGDLVRPEEDWWTAGVGFVPNSYATATVGYGHFGNLLNTVENTGWAVQLKHEF